MNFQMVLNQLAVTMNVAKRLISYPLNYVAPRSSSRLCNFALGAGFTTARFQVCCCLVRDVVGIKVLEVKKLRLSVPVVSAVLVVVVFRISAFGKIAEISLNTKSCLLTSICLSMVAAQWVSFLEIAKLLWHLFSQKWQGWTWGLPTEDGRCKLDQSRDSRDDEFASHQTLHCDLHCTQQDGACQTPFAHCWMLSRRWCQDWQWFGIQCALKNEVQKCEIWIGRISGIASFYSPFLSLQNASRLARISAFLLPAANPWRRQSNFSTHVTAWGSPTTARIWFIEYSW